MESLTQLFGLADFAKILFLIKFSYSGATVCDQAVTTKHFSLPAALYQRLVVQLFCLNLSKQPVCQNFKSGHLENLPSGLSSLS